MLLAVDAMNLWMQSAWRSDWEDPSTAEGATMHIALRTLGSVVREVRPTSVVFCWDSPSSIRREVCPSYKAGRGLSDGDDRTAGFVDLLSRLGASHLRLDGAEGDDLIAWLANQVGAVQGDGVIWSGDKDTLQLVDRWPQWRSHALWGPTDVETRFGVDPAGLPVWMALVGDRVDGIPGVPRLGPKRALRVIAETGGGIDAVCSHPLVEPHLDDFRQALVLVDLRHDPLGIQARATREWGPLVDLGRWDSFAADEVMAEVGPGLGLSDVSASAREHRLFTSRSVEELSVA